MKASCGDKSIKNLQAEMLNGCDKDTDCHLLEGTGEKIEKEPTTWNILSHQDKGTCDWRIDPQCLQKVFLKSFALSITK